MRRHRVLAGLIAGTLFLAAGADISIPRRALADGMQCGGVVATTGSAVDVTPSTAALTGTIDSPCLPVAYFEYGTTTAYGNQVSASYGVVGPGSYSASASLDGLAPNTTYHFRLVANDDLACRPTAGGTGCNTSYGRDVTFTTASLPPILTIDVAHATVTRRFRAKLRLSCPEGVAG
ncbi:MAG TPA: fibronectin type III domain-containing protein, partial [Solirubrobacteraceae bacterium]